MKTKPPTPPDGEQKISPLDDLLREMADLPSLDDLLAESKANDQAMFDELARQARKDIDALLGPEERRGDAVGPINHIEEGTKP